MYIPARNKSSNWLFELMKISLEIEPVSDRKKSFWNLDKYILQFREIHTNNHQLMIYQQATNLAIDHLSWSKSVCNIIWSVVSSALIKCHNNVTKECTINPCHYYCRSAIVINCARSGMSQLDRERGERDCNHDLITNSSANASYTTAM